ncbi:uncharacterized protein K452DRAFT_99317 [Aplosporella prunicola CBS 121167]|uniref:Secreted protein n=1 Tax=Aplosporella prunicola CBS 121167 TaxID=1176127 RepID=A0A6A6B2I2_9PEZI|nr:uncharacterized protein K452DRAFT_99317 [Aplosporella prunicola CBS 121167]KAF2137583.1 hypothetical protein K452DRAFT_99317 [Aplosporella prunicola CBS 121167]
MEFCARPFHPLPAIIYLALCLTLFSRGPLSPSARPAAGGGRHRCVGSCVRAPSAPCRNRSSVHRPAGRGSPMPASVSSLRASLFMTLVHRAVRHLAALDLCIFVEMPRYNCLVRVLADESNAINLLESLRNPSRRCIGLEADERRLLVHRLPEGQPRQLHHSQHRGFALAPLPLLALVAGRQVVAQGAAVC